MGFETSTAGAVTKVKTDKYANKVTPLSKDEYESLKQSIAERGGLYVPIAINKEGDVLDGHHRLKACQELGIKPEFEVKVFSNELLEELFVYDTNLIRRQLNDYQRGVLVLKKKPLLEELAKRNMSLGGKGSKNLETLHTDKELAKEAGVSNATLYKIEQISKAAKEDPKIAEIAEKIDSGQTSIDYAYKQIKRAEDSKKEKRAARPLPQGLFDVILADPPWKYDLNLRGSPD
jgi:ParB-like chromosome segregation protein Spo0J